MLVVVIVVIVGEEETAALAAAVARAAHALLLLCGVVIIVTVLPDLPHDLVLGQGRGVGVTHGGFLRCAVRVGAGAGTHAERRVLGNLDVFYALHREENLRISVETTQQEILTTPPMRTLMEMKTAKRTQWAYCPVWS
jgi:hypothetical protein